MMFVEVALKNSHPDYDRLYIYNVTEDVNNIFPGTLVTVEFGNRKNVEAIVVDTSLDKIPSDGYEIKDISNVVSKDISLNPEMVRLLKWMKLRYFCTYYDILRLMLPLSTPKRKKSMKTAFLKVDKNKALEIIHTNELQNIKHIRILENLIENEFIPVSELCSITSASASMIKTLEKKGLIFTEDKSYERIPEILTSNIEEDEKPELNEEQKKVVDDLIPLIGNYSQELIYGVTGSGKTEVYLRLVEETLAQGSNALILVPEIALTPQMVTALLKRFKENIAIIHSRLSLGERFDSWKKIESGIVKVVVGARSAIFSPLQDISLIVIDEEHEFTYKSETIPKYNAKEIATKRAVANNSLVVYGSATPLIETFYKAKERNALHLLPYRAASKTSTEIILVDMKEELKNGNLSLISSILKNEITKTIERGEKVMLLLNRRGFNNILICNDCKKVYGCQNCSVSLKYHKDINKLICHHCGYTITPNECRYCRSTDLSGVGYGTQYIEEELKKMFQNVPILRLDADTQISVRGSSSIMENFKKERTAIMIGTQLIAKGHDIEEVTLVGVLNADMVLSTDDFRASERTFSLISQLTGRAGRGRLHGKAVIQSLDTDDHSIVNAVADDYRSFFDDEIKIRKILGYPPFKNIAVIELRTIVKKLLDEKKTEIFEQIKETISRCEIIGPYDPYVNILSGRYRARILLKAESLKEIIGGLMNFEKKYGKKIRKQKIGLSIDVDPYQILM